MQREGGQTAATKLASNPQTVIVLGGACSSAATPADVRQLCNAPNENADNPQASSKRASTSRSSSVTTARWNASQIRILPIRSSRQPSTTAANWGSMEYAPRKAKLHSKTIRPSVK